ncbi:(2Fe-2S)-binding protein [Streptomyces sp. ISL-36]|uniref:(2Fe-2S)-binding protein n=1 Tax=Streptomyces sp. ISL-36 TaxID=2819182 RepID=UPI001BEC0161|nr:(2Fe-2S)-binding protein [Streptomyces sp. ISL-36]MBT2443211.1 (2Fe-2S)-binding protein [Streptomyces sp. ISL-36]
MPHRFRKSTDRRPPRTPRSLVDARPGRAVAFTFDGRPLTALPGQSLAAALWAAGITAWRTTRDGGRPRGAFCGIGQCFDCLITVNGRPNRRACLVPAAPGDIVTTQEGHGRADLDAR